MKAKNRLFITIIAFLLLLPFRLPISILLIYLLNDIATIGNEAVISNDILKANVVLTKIIYNTFFSCLLIYNLEIISRVIKGRRARNGDIYWWISILIFALFIYIIFDAYWMGELFDNIIKQTN